MSDVAAYLEAYFKTLRFDPAMHLGLGDVRVTKSMADEIILAVVRIEHGDNLGNSSYEVGSGEEI